VTVPPELDLVAACCRWPRSPKRDALVRRRRDRGIDWSKFAQTVRRHRVEGLVHDGLARAGVEVPIAVAEPLAASAAAIARQNLVFAAEAGRLETMLTDAGLCHLFLKGITLNALCYGSLAIKKSWDIDIAVEPAEMLSACALLDEAGYACVFPGPSPTPEELHISLAATKDTIWTNAAGVAVELHRSLVDSPLLMPGLSVHSPRQIVRLGPGIALPTLRKDELFSYLCVHGATHGWSRLKWLADVGALLGSDDGAEIARLYRRSVELGAGRCTAQALLLCRRLFDMALPDGLEDELRRDGRARYLVRAALDTMTRGGPGVELEEMMFGTISLHLSHLFLGRGWRYKAAELRRKFAPPIPAEGAGNRAGRLLGPVLRAPRWLMMRARTTRRARRG
jgi:hypothetical protein